MSNQNLIKFTNCRVLKNHKLIWDDIWVRNGVIVDPEEIFYKESSKHQIEYCMGNHILAPGLIDIQINGGYGVDFSNNSEDVQAGLQQVSKRLLENGVTAFCPTLVSSSIDIYQQTLPKYQRMKGSKLLGAEILGVHLEGPFINEKKKGAHAKNNIMEYDKGVDSLYSIYGDLENVSIVTLSPEKKNSQTVIEYLKDKGIVVSLGHTACNYHDGLKAVESGATSITHLYNAMNPFHHRDPGLIGLISNDSLYYSIIVDGVHVHPTAVKFAYKVNPKGAILVTDAISALGSPEGVHKLGTQNIEVKNNAAYLVGTNTLVGSVVKLNECVRNYKVFTGCTIEEALEAASLHPAKLLGKQGSKGSLEFGCDADLVCLDDDLNVLSTWIQGECVYLKQQ